MILGLVIGIVLGAALFELNLWKIRRDNAIEKRRLTPLDVRGLGDPTPTTLDEVIETARAAALRVVPRDDGFYILSQPPALHGRDNVFCVRSLARSNVTASALQFYYDKSYPLALHAVVALVPALGPMLVTLDDDQIIVDGSEDQHELTNAHAKFIRAKIRALRQSRS